MMKRIQRLLLSPAATLLAFVLAAALLLFSTVGGARAALTYYSETYSSRVQLSDIGVTLLENGRSVSASDAGIGAGAEVPTGKLLEDMLAGDDSLHLNKPYEESLTVRNSGAINQYVRVTLYRYWVDDQGDKRPDLDPGSIELGLVNGTDWLRDAGADTPERTVLYYRRLLRAGSETPPLSDTLTIRGDVALKTAEQALPGGAARTVYAYNGARFVLEARVDAVQENNAQAAAHSAWGRAVSIDTAAGTLSLPGLP